MLRLLITAVLSLAPFQAATFSRSESLRPVRLSTSDLIDMVQGVRRLLGTGDTSTISATLSLSDGRRSVAFGPPFDSTEAASAPPISYSAEFRFHDMGAASLVSDIVVDLSDYSRRVQVSGRSSEHVNAVANLIREKLSSHTWYLGGGFLRSIAGTLLLMLFALGPLAYSQIAKKDGTPIWMAVTSLAGVIGLFAIPWDRLLPGTQVIAGDASWLTRNSTLLSLAGLVVGVVSVVLALRPRPAAKARHR